MVLKLYGFLPEAEWTLIFHNNCIFSITIYFFSSESEGVLSNPYL